MTHALSVERHGRLDALTGRRSETGQSWLTWLRQMPEAARPAAMPGLIERLKHVREVGIEPARSQLVHQASLMQLARKAGCTTVQHGLSRCLGASGAMTYGHGATGRSVRRQPFRFVGGRARILGDPAWPLPLLCPK